MGFIIAEFLWQNRNVRFSSCSMTYLVSGSWLPEQDWAQAPSHGVRLFNQIVIGCFRNFSVTVVSAHLVGMTSLQIKGCIAELVFLFLCWCHAECSRTRTLVFKGESSKLYLSVFNGICRCCLQSCHQGVVSQPTKILVNGLLFRDFHVSPLVNNSFSEGLGEGFIWGQEMSIWDSISFIAYSFKYVCILRIFHCTRFPYNPTKDP